MKIKRPFLIASLLGFLSLLLAYRFLKTKETRFNTLEEPVPVIVSKKDILQGTKLDESLLEVTKAPRRFLQPGAAASLELVLGMITAAPILKGEQILETKLVALGAASGLAVKIPQGYRALSLEIDEVSGVGGLIRPNNFIDVLATFEMEDSSDTTQATTYTIAQRVLVLAVGDDLGAPVHSENLTRAPFKKNLFGGGTFSENLASAHKKTLTLALSPKQTQEIEFAKNHGNISVVLRPQWEEEPLDLSPTTALDVVGFKGHLRRINYREYRGR